MAAWSMSENYKHQLCTGFSIPYNTASEPRAHEHLLEPQSCRLVSKCGSVLTCSFVLGFSLPLSSANASHWHPAGPPAILVSRLPAQLCCCPSVLPFPLEHRPQNEQKLPPGPGDQTWSNWGSNLFFRSPQRSLVRLAVLSPKTHFSPALLF